MSSWLRFLFYLLVVRPLVLILLGVNVRHRERLPTQGPAILVANHNSHLDTMALFALMPMRLWRHMRPVAAMDYFLRNRILAWFSLRIIGILPILRKKKENDPTSDPLQPCHHALEQGQILIFFPEGTRGDPEQMGRFKSGVARLCEKHPDIPVIPIFLRGLGKALPKGEMILVPFFCDAFVGENLRWNGDVDGFRALLEAKMLALAQEGRNE